MATHGYLFEVLNSFPLSIYPKEELLDHTVARTIRLEKKKASKSERSKIILVYIWKILFVENPKVSTTKKWFKLINKFSKVVGYKN